MEADNLTQAAVVPGFVCNRCQQFSPLTRFSEHDTERLRLNSGTVHCPSCGIPAEAVRFRLTAATPPRRQYAG